MNKFDISPNVLREEILAECIIRKSSFAVRSNPQEFYTHNGKPVDWIKTFVKDVRGAQPFLYEDRYFLKIYDKKSEKLLWFYYEGNIYYFDSYFSDCPILSNILKND